MLLLNFVNNFFKKNISEGILGKIDQTFLSRLADLAIKGVWVNSLKKENL